MSRLVTSVSILLAIAVLWVAQAVFVPLVLAIILAMLLTGPVQRLERLRVPRAMAVTLIVSLAFGVIVLIGWLVGMQLVGMAQNVGNYRAEVLNKVRRVRGGGNDDSGTINQINKLIHDVKDEVAKPATAPSSSQPATTQAATTRSATTQAATTQGGGQLGATGPAVIVAGASGGPNDPTTAPADPAAAAVGAGPGTGAQPSDLTEAVAGQAIDRVADPLNVSGPTRAPPGRQSPRPSVAVLPTGGSSTNPATSPATVVVIPPAGTLADPIHAIVIPEPESVFRQAATYLGLALGPLGTAGIVVVFVFFMLLEREDLRDRGIRLIAHGKYTLTTTAVDDGITRIIKFMRAQAIVNGTYGITVAIGLALIGAIFGDKQFPSFLLWGLLGATLRFVPYIGPWVAAAFPLTISLAAYPGFRVFAAVIAMYLVIELLSNNIMEPMLYGATTGLSTMAILVSAVFWTWLWGPVGLLLATPLTVIMMVAGRHVPGLHFLEVLLGDRPALSPPERVYQRLLAGDEDEALGVATEHAEKDGLKSTFDQVLLPALAMGERDAAQGLLDEQRQDAVRSGTRRIIEVLGQAAAETRKEDVAEAKADAEAQADGENGAVAAGTATAAAASTDSRVATIRVALLPAHDEGDTLAALMLAHLLRHEGYDVLDVSHTGLAAEMVEEVTGFNPHVVCISATPPAAVSHVRYLLRRLQGRLPQERLAIGVWSAQSDVETLRKRLDLKAAVPLAVSLQDAIVAIGKLTEDVRHTAPVVAAAPVVVVAGPR